MKTQRFSSFLATSIKLVTATVLSVLISQTASAYSSSHTSGHGFILEKIKDTYGFGNFGYLTLTVEYFGKLHDGCVPTDSGSEADCDVFLYVKLNGRDVGKDYIKMVPQTYYDGERKTYAPYHVIHIKDTSLGMPSPMVAALPDLFYFAKDQFGRLNMWDVEVAVRDGLGNWDNNNGNNYKFSF